MDSREIYIYDNSLYHFGRSKRDGAPIGSGRYPLGSGESKNNAKLSKKQIKQLRKRTNLMSDEEIDRMIARLKKENELNDLFLKNNPKAKAAEEGKKAVKDTLSQIGKKVFTSVATTALTGLALYVIGSGVSKINTAAGEAAATGKVKGFNANNK